MARSEPKIQPAGTPDGAGRADAQVDRHFKQMEAGSIALLEAKELERQELMAEVYSLEQQRRGLLSTLGPIGSLVLLAEIFFADRVFRWVSEFGLWEPGAFSLLLTQDTKSLTSHWLAFVFRLLGLWLVTLVPVAATYFFRFRQRTWGAQRRLLQVETEIRQVRTSTSTGRLQFLQEELSRLTDRIGLVLLHHEERYEKARQWRERVEELLAEAAGAAATGAKSNLGEAQSLLNSLRELVQREENELGEQRNWQRLAILITAFYICGVLALTVVLHNNSAKQVPIFNIPVPVVMWGALGSLAAILYRFYTSKERVRFDGEIRWLVARPIIGIIMGALAYLALQAGLFVLIPGGGQTSPAGAVGAGAATGNPEALPLGRMEIHWVVAFLAGFSDRFYERIIELLVTKAVGEKKPEAPGNPVGQKPAEPVPVPAK